jgi:hypothetical protein
MLPFVYASSSSSNDIQNSIKKITEIERISGPEFNPENAYRQLCQMLIKDFFEDMYKGNQYFISRVERFPENLILLFKDNLERIGDEDINYSSLAEAIKHIEKGNLDATSHFGVTIFMEALSGKWATKPKTIEFFISLGVNIHSKSISFMSPLLFVLENKMPWKTELINILLNSGLDLNKRDSRSRTFLMNYLRELFALRESEKHVLDQLLIADKSWKYDTCDIGYSAIMYAAQAGNKPVVKFLLERGAAENESLARKAMALLFRSLNENRHLEMLEIGAFSSEALEKFNLHVKVDYLSDLEIYFNMKN